MEGETKDLLAQFLYHLADYERQVELLNQGLMFLRLK
jgi:hypothetical protein